tara:strand:- start:853 stop:1164 length:312 start_codon:yes stop_codon:yes gene_type:complete
MSKAQRDKGLRVEREIVNACNHPDVGIKAERVPLSGAAGGSYTGDIMLCDKFRCEVKSRKDGAGFRLLYKWKGLNDILIIKQDRSAPLFIMDLDTLSRLMKEG